MKNLSHKEHSEYANQENPKELAAQGYQRRFFNSSPLVFELASALDQALAEAERFLTQEERDGQGLETELDDLASPFIQDSANKAQSVSS